jgi:hypothetical protein
MCIIPLLPGVNTIAVNKYIDITINNMEKGNEHSSVALAQGDNFCNKYGWHYRERVIFSDF